MIYKYITSPAAAGPPRSALPAASAQGRSAAIPSGGHTKPDGIITARPA
jgi:hypothetical protein